MSTEHEEHKPEEGGSEEPLIAEADRVNVGMIALVTVVIVSVTVAVVIGVQQFFNETVRGEQAKKLLALEDPRIRDTAALEAAHLGKYQWVNQKDGVVRIPIDRAREIVLAEYGKMPPYVPGSEAPAPAPAPAPEASASASASASGSASAAPSSSAPPAGSTSAAPPVPASASAAPHGSASAHH